MIVSTAIISTVMWRCWYRPTSVIYLGTFPCQEVRHDDVVACLSVSSVVMQQLTESGITLRRSLYIHSLVSSRSSILAACSQNNTAHVREVSPIVGDRAEIGVEVCVPLDPSRQVVFCNLSSSSRPGGRWASVILPRLGVLDSSKCLVSCLG